MTRASRWAAAGGVLLALALPAWAAGWGSYGAAFPSNPCGDGWVGCVVGGAPLGPGLAKDGAGRPMPAGTRVGWFDLEPTASLSPFVGLSGYRGAPMGAVAASQPAVDAATALASGPAPTPLTPTASPTASPGTAPATGTATPPSPTTDRVAMTAAPTTTTTTSSPSTSMGASRPPTTDTPSGHTTSQASTGRTDVSSPSASPSTVVTVPPPATGTAQPVATTSTAAPATGTATPPPTTATTATATGTATPPHAANCEDVASLEPLALMGQLDGGTVQCAETKVTGGGSQTSRDKYSRVLIANAEAKGDKGEWERLIRRHLEEIDRSDPDLCYKYALHLSRGGTSRASGVIRWSDYALENKHRWQGEAYRKRVYALLKLRAVAAGKLWEAAEAEYTTGAHTEENEAVAAKRRGQARDFAKEWLDYARSSNQDPAAALALCVSSAGNRQFCDGG